MTVAAFLLECETCHDKQGLLVGVVESFICLSCAADKAFGPGGLPQTVRPPVPSPSPVGPSFSAADKSSKDYERGWQDVRNDERRVDARNDAERLPMTFRCPSCGQVRRWHLAKAPWPGAVCATCYAERQDHREGY